MTIIGQIADVAGLSAFHAAALKRGNYTHVTELFAQLPQDVAKRCRVPLRDVNDMLDTLSRSIFRPLQLLSEIISVGSASFTTGSSELDRMLGGGVRTGMIWEITGEGASGKTQLALQLSLLVQLPVSQQGLGGSACYLTTHAATALPTSRLLEIATEHPLLSESDSVGLTHIRTLEIRTVDMLLHALSSTLLSLLESTATEPMPVKLLVVDSFTDVFVDDEKTSTAQLAERSGNLSRASILLHDLANKYQLAVVIINNVVDVWDYPPQTSAHELIYAEHSRLFNSGDSIAAETRKKAALGLVWANQVNARIMLTRTSRRRHLESDPDPPAKRQRVASGSALLSSSANQPSAIAQGQDMLIRRLSILFSSVSPPSSADFIITSRGVEILPEAGDLAIHPSFPIPSVSADDWYPPLQPSTLPSAVVRLGDVTPLDVACEGMEVDDDRLLGPSFEEVPPDEEDEEESYWKAFEDIEFEALDGVE